jgi:hypothetical protein
MTPTLQRSEGESYRHFHARQLAAELTREEKSKLEKAYHTWRLSHEGDFFDFVAIQYRVW